MTKIPRKIKGKVERNDFWSLIPYDEETEEKLSGIPYGVPLNIELSQPRSRDHHAAYFAMINAVWQYLLNERENKEIGDVNNLRRLLQVEAGYFDIFIYNGEVIKYPKSIAFKELDELQFRELHNKVLDVIFSRYGDRMADNPDLVLMFNDFSKWKEKSLGHC